MNTSHMNNISYEFISQPQLRKFMSTSQSQCHNLSQSHNSLLNQKTSHNQKNLLKKFAKTDVLVITKPKSKGGALETYRGPKRATRD
jgi:hypothetical protein